MNAKSRKPGNRIRIIGGDWRSRVLDFPDLPELRPTPDRVRETLFNWLQFDITGARCLDLFAGSGVLGFEALSRGAASVMAFETDTSAVRALRENASRLGARGYQLTPGSALEWLQHGTPQTFDIVFLDPPFGAKLHAEVCRLLQTRGWLSARARVYIEAPEPFASLGLPAEWQVLREKRAGDVYYGLCGSADE